MLQLLPRGVGDADGRSGGGVAVPRIQERQVVTEIRQEPGGVLAERRQRGAGGCDALAHLRRRGGTARHGFPDAHLHGGKLTVKGLETASRSGEGLADKATNRKKARLPSSATLSVVSNNNTLIWSRIGGGRIEGDPTTIDPVETMDGPSHLLRRPALLVLVAFGGCQSANEGATAELNLNGYWAAGTGVFRVPAGAPSMSTVELHRTITLPESWVHDASIRLRAEASGWRVSVTVNGAEAGSDTGGLWAASVDVTGRLRAGENELTVTFEPPTEANVRLGASSSPVAAWTSGIPRQGQVWIAGELSLQFDGTHRVDALDVRLVGDELVARAHTSGAVGSTAHFEVVRDGVVITPLPDGVVAADGTVESRGTWTGPIWQVGGSETPALQYVTVSVGAGSLRQRRFGARTVALAGDHVSINGKPVYLAGQRYSQGGEDIRGRFARLRHWMLASGTNAVELHGAYLDPRVLDAADELGLPLVVTPRCEGQAKLDGAAAETADRRAFLDAGDARIAAVAASHPSAILWPLEEMGSTRVSAAFAGLDGVVITSDRHWGMEEKRFADFVAEKHVPDFINELPSWTLEPVEGRSLGARLAPLVAMHVPIGIGAIFPELGVVGEPRRAEAPAGKAYASELREELATAGVLALSPGDRRGPSTLVVRALRGNRPVGGVPITLRAPRHALIGGFTDSTGKATIVLDYAGAAEIGVLGSDIRLGVSLTPGAYRGGRWYPTLTAVDVPDVP